MPEFTPGDVFADHRIEALAGRGGMGVVYRATQLGLERTVALKVISPVLADDEDFRRRFVAESKAAASVEHPNVIPVHHAGERDDVLFIVMRYVDGPDLRALIRAEGCLGPERAAHVIAQLGGALDAAHRHGLVHRDVKPANVLLDRDDHVYLTDFGLTKRVATSAGGGVSRSGGWVGTLGYVAPEQIRGERIDARTDVYALGCVLVHALTGSAPYMRDSDEATLWAHLNAPPPSQDVPPRFQALVERALAKDPAQRYPSAGDLGRAALAAAGDGVLPGRERIVARGVAAPPGEGEGETLALTPSAAARQSEGETHPSPDGTTGTAEATGATGTAGSTASTTSTTTVTTATRRGARRDGSAGRHIALAPRRTAIVAGAGVLAAAAITAIAAAVFRDSANAPSKTTVTAASSRDPGPRASIAGEPMHGVTSPLSLASTAGKVWVSGRSRRLAVYDASTGGRVAPRPDVGAGAHAIAAGHGSVWVLNAATNEVIRIDARTGRRAASSPGRVAALGRAVVIATGGGAVWVGVRNRVSQPRNESVVRIDPDGGRPRAILVPAGVQDLAVAGRSLWVTNRASSTVTRISTSTLKIQNVIPVGGDPRGIAVGAGAAWVAAAADDALARIDLGDLKVTRIALKASPDRVAVGGGAVWVTSRAAGRLLRVDPLTRRLRESIATGYDPLALDVVGDDGVWLVLLREQAVQRVRFYE